MPQQSIFSTRYGLNVPRGENLQATEIFSEGGLDLTQSVLETRPGFASSLVNYEVALTGGYRRINGFAKYSSTVVPGQGQLLGVAVFPTGFILAARRDAVDGTKYNMYTGSGTTWTKINTSNLTYTAGMIVTYCTYNWTGTYIISFTDGVNPSYTWDGTNYVVLNGAGSAADPTFCTEFSGYYFVSGYSANKGAVKISAPLNATDWATVDGAAEVVVGDTVTWLQPWRQQLIIFCKNSIYRIVGNSTNTTSSSPFTLQQITDRVGCLEGRTVREIDGDLIYLAQDGFRTISGTFKIGDTEIGSISRQIQELVSGVNPITTPCHSIVVRRKTQYRLFYCSSSNTDANSLGIVGGIRRFRDGHEDWEWGQLQGIKVACAASGYFFTDNQEYIVHGGFDGFVYRQEQAGTFNGVTINDVYKTVPLEFGDRGIRKVLHRITVYITSESGSVSQNISMVISYNLGDNSIPQPTPIALVGVGANQPFTYDSSTSIYDTSGVIYDLSGTPLFRQNVTGSGFLAQIQFSSNNSQISFTIQGMLIEYFPGGRR